MSLADIELTKLKIDPLFMHQVDNTVELLKSVFPTRGIAVYLISEEGIFTRFDTPASTRSLPNSISGESSARLILESQKEVTSHIVARDKLFLKEDAGSADSGDILVTPLRYDGDLTGYMLNELKIPDKVTRDEKKQIDAIVICDEDLRL